MIAVVSRRIIGKRRAGRSCARCSARSNGERYQGLVSWLARAGVVAGASAGQIRRSMLATMA